VQVPGAGGPAADWTSYLAGAGGDYPGLDLNAQHVRGAAEGAFDHPAGTGQWEVPPQLQVGLCRCCSPRQRILCYSMNEGL
jgi:hypothetical protein